MYGLHVLGRLVGNPAMDYSFVQVWAVRQRHRDLMQFLKKRDIALVLFLFPWSWRTKDKRPTQLLVRTLVNVLGFEPDWWEVCG